MGKQLEEQIEELQTAISAQEGLRATVGDTVVDTAVAALRQQLAELEAQAIPGSQRRRLATVLFADMSGFTAMSETMDAEEVADLINVVWQSLDAAIVAHGGVIDKHIGDAVMALWGSEVAREDAPEQAIRAALAMQAALADFNQTRRVKIGIRIGINTGPVLLGRVGTTSELTAIGDTVNIASRLENAAPVGGILISHGTYGHVRGIFDEIRQEPLAVKGKAEPIRTYTVLGIKPRAFRVASRGVEGIETRMVGRDAELMALKDTLGAAIGDGRAHMVTVVGEAGAGKSRLLYEFDNWIKLQPDRFDVFKGRATEEMANTPYGVVHDMFRYRFNILESDSTATVRDKFRTGMEGYLAADGTDLVGHLVGHDFSASKAVGELLGSPEFGKRAMDALLSFVHKVATDTPTVLFLEDIHWADGRSLDLIVDLVTKVSDAPMLVVCSARPLLFERRPEWGSGKVTQTRVDLKPLAEHDTQALVSDILQKVDAIPNRLRALIVDSAEGNPFYVEEMIMMLIDNGAIVCGDKRWYVDPGRLDESSIPSTLTGVLQARLDSLPAKETEVLQRASVIGRLFWDAIVAALGASDGHEPDVGAALDAICMRELIFPRGRSTLGNAREYIFKHGLLRVATYETVLLKVRRTYHLQVAMWLEANAGERIDEYLSLIARHYERAAEPAKAIHYWQRAGQQSMQRSMNAEAISLFSNGLALVKTLPDDMERAQLELGLQTALGPALMASFGPGAPQVEKTYSRALELCRQVGETPQLFPVLFGLWRFHLLRAKLETAREIAERLLGLAERDGDPAYLLEAHFALGGTLFWIGETALAREHLEQSIALYDSLEHRKHVFLYGQDPLALCLSYLAFALWILGYPDQALEKVRAAHDVARELDHPFSLAYILYAASMVHQMRREPQATQEWAEAAITLATERSFPYFVALSAMMRGWALAEIGRTEVGIEQLQNAIRNWTATGSKVAGTYYLGLLAQAHGKAGSVPEALATLADSLSEAQATGESYWKAELYRLRGQLSLIRDADEVEAERDFRRAFAIARHQHARSLELRVAIDLHRLLKKRGSGEESRALLAEVYDWFTEGFDTPDLQDTRALLGQLPRERV